MLDSLYSSIYIYLVSLSVITSIKSYSSFVYKSYNAGNLVTKSIVINSHGLEGVFGYFMCLYRACLAALFRIHISHLITTLLTVFLIPRK